ncbi:hypothetical protein [Variovorax sp. J31P207]|uniref:hypothetical protein n=1 Tax=Variovorax sp. J31P207 TaxID=3053510 RepID=UPI0025756408|nr:hypothetical protein [Variovorax sp. J31P207]MDM0066614.1 hypothetical protein [Variovorax sp. J31P207]
MHANLVLPSNDPPLRSPSHPTFRPGVAALLQTVQARQYCEMEQAFSSRGGLLGSDEVVALLMMHTDQPISQLARWIVDREVLSLNWRSRTVLPLFQFDRSTMTPRSSVTAVIQELIPALGDWEMCLWFIAPSACLAETSPLDAISLDAPAVVDAARCERYLLRG